MGKKGRPSKYTAELADSICHRLAQGEALTLICKAEDMPDRVTVYRWLDAHEDFRNNYARAREAQADFLAEEILSIADDGRNDFRMVEIAEGVEVPQVDHEHINRSKLRVDARKWYAGKVAPKKYGDKVQQEISGKDGAELVPVINFYTKTE